jgi:L-fuconolactonase
MALEVTGRYRYPPPAPAWLALAEEPVLDAAQPIVDAHHHVWEEPGNRYLADELLADLAGSGHRIEATVFVQAGYGYRAEGPAHLRPVGETERVESLRRSLQGRLPGVSPCAAIVGFADLLRGAEVAEVIEAHRAASPVFRGVRQSTARDRRFPEGIVLKPAPEGMMGSAAFVAGVRTVAAHGLTFDAMVYHEQLPEVLELASAVPECTLVLDHFGCPIGVGPHEGEEAERFARWSRDIRALACCPNVHVKLGGLGMIVTGARYHLAPSPPTSMQLAADWHPWVETCLEAFGARRCLFESNFPVDKAMFPYRTLWNAWKRLAAPYSEAERHALFHGTATRLYRLANH